MPKATTYQCPSCNGVMRFDAAKGQLVCDFCGNTFSQGEHERDIPVAQAPVDASSKMPDAHMDAIAPFDFGKLRDFSSSYVAGYLAEVPDESVEACLPRAEARVRSAFDDQLAADARRSPKVDSVNMVAGETKVDVTGVSTCVLPVWLMHCTWEENQMLFAVNGETGKCVGDLPTDRTRRTVTLVVGILIALVIAGPLIVALFTEDDMPDFLFFIAGLILAIPFFFDMHFKSQMHSASEAELSGMDMGLRGIVITESWDGPKFHLRTENARADFDALSQ